MHQIYTFNGECVQISFILCVTDCITSDVCCILNRIVHNTYLVPTRTAIVGKVRHILDVY